MLTKLPVDNQPLSLAAFIQTTDDGKVVLNGFQAGRYKYVSRFLNEPGEYCQGALSHIRQSLDEQHFVQLDTDLGLNFQLHPQLTRYRLQNPLAASQDDDVIKLSELELFYDQQANRLRLYVPRLGHCIEPAHFGFLRDANLPEPQRLLAAMTPLGRDESIAERADLYFVLDQLSMMQHRSMPAFRPRLEVGQLVLERARWAIPLDELPVKKQKERYADFFVRINSWLRELGLPTRGFARVVYPQSLLTDMGTPRHYMDWQSPITLAGLKRLYDNDKQGGYLMFTELLPESGESVLTTRDGRHNAEWMVQFDLEEQP